MRSLATLLLATSCALALEARADWFELNLKVTCFEASSSRYLITKEELSGPLLIGHILGVGGDIAKTDDITIDPLDGSVYVVRSCDGGTIKSLQASRLCDTEVQPEADPAKYATSCSGVLGGWEGTTLDGELVCSMQGKTKSGDVSSAKGSCIGSFLSSTNGNCQMQGKIGKRFVPKGNCPT
ncbi:MAG TPA: hypothetical protein VMR86_21790 [Myxococcota bacterium]|nr:hypothetical protein [Myxococcota bacterium]